MILQLPYPPSANTYYRRSGRVIHLSQKGREYKSKVVAAVMDQAGAISPLQGPVSIRMALSPPDLRKRDLDNTIKPVWDSLTAAGVWVDDSQVKSLFAEMLGKVPGGLCAVEVNTL